MTQKGRILTLVVELTSNEYPQWIVDAHLGQPKNNVKIKSISEGDLVKELQKIEEEYEGQQ